MTQNRIKTNIYKHLNMFLFIGLLLHLSACADCGSQVVDPSDTDSGLVLVTDSGPRDAVTLDVLTLDALRHDAAANPDTSATDAGLLDAQGGEAGTGATCQNDQACASGHCLDFHCVDCIENTDCTDALCLDGQCLAGCAPGDRCELGGSCCPAGEECAAGECRSSCAGQRCGINQELCCGAGTLCQDQRCVNDCGARDRCGVNADVCCADGEMCYRFACITPHAGCQIQDDCPDGQSCEPDQHICLDDADIGECLYHPPVGVFNPQLEWSWESSDFDAAFNQVMMAPVVADLNDDNNDGLVDQNDIPDVAFITFQPSNGTYNARGILRVVSGDGSGELFSIEDYNFHPGGGPAIGDLDLDGLPEIVADMQTNPAKSITGVYAMHNDGSFFWQADGAGCATGALSIANLNNDAYPEIITCNQILDHLGQKICSYPKTASVPVAADIDLDGVAEVVTGGGAWRAEADNDGHCVEVWRSSLFGNVAIANFNNDPNPEIVFPSGGKIRMVDHDDHNIWTQDIPLDIPRIASMITGFSDCAHCSSLTSDSLRRRCTNYCKPGGGPPTIADFDGDGKPEIGLAARWYYLVYDDDGSVLWAHKTRDFSSAVTGSSVFDFDGDGQAEVVYNDENFLRVYRGQGGTQDSDGDGFIDADVLLELPNPSGTLYEYPLIVDVDADGRAEIVLAANNYAFAGFTGIRVFGDAQDNWVGTRRIWNQHAYSVSNICDGTSAACTAADNIYGRVPAHPINNWELPWLNNFRQNVQGEGLFWAPDLVIQELAFSCDGQGRQTVHFAVANQGSRFAPTDIPVSIYLDGVLVTTLTTSQALRPGEQQWMTYILDLPGNGCAGASLLRVVADDRGDGEGTRNECEHGGEDNNALEIQLAPCPSPDLVVQNMRIECQSEGGANLNFIVTNQGDRAVAAGIPVQISLDGDVQNTVLTTQSLLAGESEAFVFAINAASGCDLPAGILVSVDANGSGGVVSECATGAENNNNAELLDSVCPSADLQIQQLGAQCIASNGGSAIALTFALYNDGPSSVASGISIAMSVDNNIEDFMFSTTPLAAGESEQMQWTWAVDDGMFNRAIDFTVSADQNGAGQGQIVECGPGDEDNNSASTQGFCSSGG